MFEFKLPDLGEGVHEGQVVSLRVKEGDQIKEYEPLMEVETDKAAVEIPSPKSGIVSKLLVKPGQVVKVGQVMVVFGDGAADAAPAAAPAAAKPATAAAPAAAAKAPAPSLAAAKAPAPAPTPAARPATPAPAAARPAPAPAPVAHRAPTPAPAPQPVESSGPVPAAPAVRKLARELGVNLAAVAAQVAGGRVTREDVERFAQNGGTQHHATTDAGAMSLPMIPGDTSLPDFSQYGPIRRETPPMIRKTIARQMTRAWLSVPRVTHGDNADLTELERNRKEFNGFLKEGQAKLTVTAIVIKALAAAIREFPQFNCSYDSSSEEIIYKDFVNVGIAVDTPRGLVVPVLRDADKKSLLQIAADLGGIGERARTAKFDVAELRGGTITVTNVGALGGTFATPMVNYPEVAILGMSRAVWQPMVMENKEIRPRLILPLSLSFDHRVLDGADAARFTRHLIGSLENPLRLLSFS